MSWDDDSFKVHHNRAFYGRTRMSRGYNLLQKQSLLMLWQRRGDEGESSDSDDDLSDSDLSDDDLSDNEVCING